MSGPQQYQTGPQGHRSQGTYPPSFAQGAQPLGNMPMQMTPFAQNYPRQSGYNYMAGQPSQESYFLNVGQTGIVESTLHLQGERPRGKTTKRPNFVVTDTDSLTGVSRQSSASSLGPSVPRGPPPKPKQSGHALWVGNLPPGTTIFDLKDHFSREATNDIESVFLISKSNCAFANYKTEAACAAAMQRFNDTRFLGARLVCRLRRPNPTSASAGSQADPSAQATLEVSSSPEVDPKNVEESPTAETAEEAEKGQGATASEQAPEPTTRVKEKFFIIKSLTVEDLELSVRNGIWATQAHNEAALNTAFEVRTSFHYFHG